MRTPRARLLTAASASAATAAALVVAVAPPASAAAPTTTSVTGYSGAAYRVVDGDHHSPAIEVTGTSNGSSGNVNIRCYYGPASGDFDTIVSGAYRPHANRRGCRRKTNPDIISEKG